VITAPLDPLADGPVGESDPEELPQATDVASRATPSAKTIQRDFDSVITSSLSPPRNPAAAGVAIAVPERESRRSLDQAPIWLCLAKYRALLIDDGKV
jgi:hypothetical protein